ncbi:MAG: amidohydrolase family protein [Rhodospirillaceae bacterium]|nr:amidohydrolase family protein [Rhodospirillales bacterium]MBT3929972.1 amidohydrolase family protein [Rhodospirillaceae bacterium]MBT4771731.1 amidohydrolase family protein [Rhodospirillaceae bacterium]MBT5357913.1 amidohydrolase family protein [Rhodospirillaceae bacterium]MBT5768100.1 amidohydrolase family protein [Rhodospirillaceae bacterium]
MADEFDVIIRHARLRGSGDKTFDIGVSGGLITQLSDSLSGTGADEIDAKNGLVTESYANPHLHLCKVWTLDMMGDDAIKDYHGGSMGKAMSAIERASVVKENYDASWIADNARRAVALAAQHGNLHIRAFADVDAKARLEGVKALLEVRDEFSGIVEVQVVAFAQDGIVREPGAAELMREAMQLGADVVGGIPWIEFTDADADEHIRVCFDLAQEFDKDVSMLLDDAGDAGLRTLEAMAVEAINRGWEGRALAHHCRAMSLYPQPYFQKLVSILRRARVPVVSDPHTGPLHARVQELLEEDVLVCLGQDDISDAYYPFGRNNMLEVAFLASHMLWMTSRDEIERLYDLVTTNAAQSMNVENFGLTPGCVANLVVLGEPNVVEALRNHQAPVAVVSNGKIVDLARMSALSARS